MQKPVEKPIKFKKNLSTKGKSFPVTHVSAVIDDNGESIKSTIDSLKNKSSMTEVTWQELKDKRDAGKLTPGSLYRITDYQCTTAQENTRSAGHQFDIVLLALSEDKLAEEGWAMEHPTDVYDVTFGDGVTLKCYLYFFDDETDCNIVLVADTSIGHNLGVGKEDLYYDGIIDEENKTLFVEALTSNGFLTEGKPLPYNYFQNSNLSAWKVWYCLDNDKSRFAWAEKDVPTFICNINVPSAGLSFENVRVIRDYGADYDGRYAYVVINGDTVTNIATDRELKDSGDYTIYLSVYVSANAHVEILSSSVTTNGRGVIYRLIDEFNNDVAYDFKNIQFVRKLDNNGHVTNEGTKKWIFTFSLYNIEDDELLDASLNYPKFVTDEGGWHITSNNKICRVHSYDDGNEPLYDTGVNRQCLNDTVFTFVAVNYDRAPSIRNNVILTAYNCSFPDVKNLVVLWSVNRNYTTYISSLDNRIIEDDRSCTFQQLS